MWFEIAACCTKDQYINNLDNDRLEAWPTLFTEDCLYEIIPKENADMGLPIGIIYCDNKKMLRDRVVSLRNARISTRSIASVVTCWHMTSGLLRDRRGDATA